VCHVVPGDIGELLAQDEAEPETSSQPASPQAFIMVLTSSTKSSTTATRYSHRLAAASAPSAVPEGGESTARGGSAVDGNASG
jgi:hypothetical protein